MSNCSPRVEYLLQEVGKPIVSEYYPYFWKQFKLSFIDVFPLKYICFIRSFKQYKYIFQELATNVTLFSVLFGYVWETLCNVSAPFILNRQGISFII